MLCNVALDITAPPISIGSRIPMGATTPLFPVFHSTSNNLVTTPASLVLNAYAPLAVSYTHLRAHET